MNLFAPMVAQAPPAILAEKPVSAVDIRRAALLATEGTGEQSVSDINQVLKNRLKHGGYGKDFDSMAVRPRQFAGIQDRGTKRFLNIRTWDDAARYTGTSVPILKTYHNAVTDPKMQMQSLKHVGGALEFRASEENYMPLPNTSQRLRGQPGGSLHNQFLTGPDDPHIKISIPKPTPVKPKTKIEKSNWWDPLKIFGKQGSQFNQKNLQIANYRVDPNWKDPATAAPAKQGKQENFIFEAFKNFNKNEGIIKERNNKLIQMMKEYGYEGK